MNVSVPNFMKALFGEPIPEPKWEPPVYEIVDPPSDDGMIAQEVETTSELPSAPAENDLHRVMTISDYHPSPSTQWQSEPIKAEEDAIPGVPKYLIDLFKILIREISSSVKQ